LGFIGKAGNDAAKTIRKVDCRKRKRAAALICEKNSRFAIVD
jgi:hypothetical protein